MSVKKNTIDSIAKHVMILNEEIGVLKNDVKWIKRVVYYLAGIISIAIGKIIFLP